MCLFENSKILETGIKMMQPDMIRMINGYKAYYTIDEMISQIYTFEVKKEKLILDTTVPDASMDLLFLKKHQGNLVQESLVQRRAGCHLTLFLKKILHILVYDLSLAILL